MVGGGGDGLDYRVLHLGVGGMAFVSVVGTGVALRRLYELARLETGLLPWLLGVMPV